MKINLFDVSVGKVTPVPKPVIITQIRTQSLVKANLLEKDLEQNQEDLEKANK